MKKVSRLALAKKLVTLWDDHSKKELLTYVATQVVHNKKQAEVDLLVNDIGQELFTQKQHLFVRVISAHELDTTLQEKIADYIVAHYRPKTTEWEWQVDPDIVGGVVIETPFHRFEFDIKSRLEKL